MPPATGWLSSKNLRATGTEPEKWPAGTATENRMQATWCHARIVPGTVDGSFTAALWDCNTLAKQPSPVYQHAGCQQQCVPGSKKTHWEHQPCDGGAIRRHQHRDGRQHELSSRVPSASRSTLASRGSTRARINAHAPVRPGVHRVDTSTSPTCTEDTFQ